MDHGPLAALAPYLTVALVGVAPNEIFRIAGLVLANGIRADSEVFAWIRYLATSLLAAVVAKLIFAPAPALGAFPLTLRVAAVAVGIVAYFATRRSLFAGVMIGEAAFIGAAWLLDLG